MGGKLKKPRRSTYRPLSDWQKSASFRYMAKDAIAAVNRRRDSLPKCGAKCRSGDACRNIAMGNGRCWRHGGLTPSGDQWGRRQVKRKPPRSSKPSDWRKFERKRQEQERQDKDAARRLRQMTDDEFQSYQRRMGRRLRGKIGEMVEGEERRRYGLTGRLGAPSTRPPDPELEAIERRIAELKELRAAALSRKSDQGVFG